MPGIQINRYIFAGSPEHGKGVVKIFQQGVLSLLKTCSYLKSAETLEMNLKHGSPMYNAYVSKNLKVQTSFAKYTKFHIMFFKSITFITGFERSND